MSQSQTTSHRVYGNLMNSQSLSNLDFLTLDSSFGRLSVSDSSARQNGNQIFNNQYDQVINGGVQPNGYGDRHHNELELQRPYPLSRLYQGQRSSFENVNGFYGYDARLPPMLNNVFSNRVASSSRNRGLDQNSVVSPNVFDSGLNSWRSNKRFYGSNLENRRGSSMLEIAKDVVLSEGLKRRIDESSQEMFNMIFNGLNIHVCDLMTDPIGINVFQSLVRKSSSEQVTMIIDIVTQNNYWFFLICSHSHGNVAILSLLEYIRFFRYEDQITRLVEAIRRVTLELTRKCDGHNVSLCCFNWLHVSQFQENVRAYIKNHIKRNIGLMSCNMYGNKIRKKLGL